MSPTIRTARSFISCGYGVLPATTRSSSRSSLYKIRGDSSIAAQPFLLQARAAGTARRHVPDFLLTHADGSVRVVNVKPAGTLAEPRIAEALAWPGRLVEGHGWQYEIWSGADPMLLANLRFLGGYRRPGLLPEGCWTTSSPRSCRATRSAA
ncbi:MAG TPA: TnsA-like heteromeric transposase endonuclease subunit [Streptosporangiaceae bacterium]